MVTTQQIAKLKEAEKEFVDTVKKLTDDYRAEVRNVIEAIDKDKMTKVRKDLGL